MSRASLSLKFKLSKQLVSQLANEINYKVSESADNQRNQSHRQRQQPGRNYNNQLQLRIQCKYKLTEVSDVTFNELTFTTNQQQQQQSSFAPLNWPDSNQLQVFKSAHNQVTQWRSSASLEQLWAALTDSTRWPTRDTCQLGALALQPDDPLIFQPDLVADQRRRRRELLQPFELGQSLVANCCTLASLPMQPRQAAESHFCSDRSTRRKALISGRSAANEPSRNQLVEGQQSVGYLSIPEWPLSSLPLVESAADEMAGQKQTLAEWLRNFTTVANTNYLDAPPLLEWFINNQEVSVEPVQVINDASRLGQLRSIRLIIARACKF